MANNENKEDMLKKITEKECSKRLCKCGERGCEFAADFFDADGNPTLEFGEDEDLIESQNLEAAQDYSDYSERVGADEEDLSCKNGESKYRYTATYKMIDPDCDSADCGKS